jgi:hypothetical protein
MVFIEFILPANYNWFHIIVPAPSGLYLSIDGNFVKYCDPPQSDHKQAFTPLQKIKIQEGGGVIGYAQSSEWCPFSVRVCPPKTIQASEKGKPLHRSGYASRSRVMMSTAHGEKYQ